MTRIIHIKPALNGWVVKVGCREVVFTDLETMLNGLKTYYTYPDLTEDQYLHDAVNKVTEDNSGCLDAPTIALPRIKPPPNP